MCKRSLNPSFRSYGRGSSISRKFVVVDVHIHSACLAGNAELRVFIRTSFLLRRGFALEGFSAFEWVHDVAFRGEISIFEGKAILNPDDRKNLYSPETLATEGLFSVSAR
jgi:hypothetical protein